MSTTEFHAVQGVLSGLVATILVPKLYESKKTTLGFALIIIFSATFSMLFNPHEFDAIEKAIRGLLVGVAVAIGGVAFVWVKKKWPNL